jgi:serine/threonine-protein kinase
MGSYPSVAISPDGQHIAYVATHEGVSQLYLRDVAEFNGRPLPGTGDAHTPFFSPDGQWLGAVAGRKVVKIPIAGGPPVTLSTIPYAIYGACWGSDGWIYFGTEPPLGLVKIPVTGGVALGQSAVDDDHGERDHRYPEILPGNRWLLFTASRAGHTFDDGEIDAISLKNGDRKNILKGGSNPRYIASGHLAFVHAGKLMVVPFDPTNLQVKGEPVAMVDGVTENPTVGAGQYAVAADGTLVYSAGSSAVAQRELVLMDRSGTARVLSAGKQPYEEVALSPDGRQIAVTTGAQTTDIWIHDIASGTEKQFTSHGEHRSPVWSPDGKRLIYAGYTGKEDAEYVIFQKALDGAGSEQTLRVSETPIQPWFTSPDGRSLIFEENGRGGNAASQLMAIDGSRAFRNLTPRDFDETWAQLSPDGHWLAFNSDESGQQEVYVQTFPGMISAVKISAGGGVHPQWSPDGKELYYLTTPHSDAPRPFAKRVGLMAASIEASPDFHAGTPHLLFEGPFFEGGHDYAVTHDGKGFILIRDSEPGQQTAELKVIVNWAGELRRRLPVK